MVSATCYSLKPLTLRSAPTSRTASRMYIPKTKEGAKSLWSPGSNKRSTVSQVLFMTSSNQRLHHCLSEDGSELLLFRRVSHQKWFLACVYRQYFSLCHFESSVTFFWLTCKRINIYVLKQVVILACEAFNFLYPLRCQSSAFPEESFVFHLQIYWISCSDGINNIINSWLYSSSKSIFTFC